MSIANGKKTATKTNTKQRFWRRPIPSIHCIHETLNAIIFKEAWPAVTVVAIINDDQAPLSDILYLLTVTGFYDLRRVLVGRHLQLQLGETGEGSD